MGIFLKQFILQTVNMVLGTLQPRSKCSDLLLVNIVHTWISTPKLLDNLLLFEEGLLVLGYFGLKPTLLGLVKLELSALGVLEVLYLLQGLTCLCLNDVLDFHPLPLRISLPD